MIALGKRVERHGRNKCLGGHPKAAIDRHVNRVAGVLTRCLCNVHSAQVGTKTISLKDEAYKRLSAARRYPDESFSEVVLRATWPEDTITAKAFLGLFGKRRVHFQPDELDRVDAHKKDDRPPEDKWDGR